MLQYNPQSLSASPARSITVNGQQRRALRKLLRDLVAFTGTAINDLAATPRKAPQPKRQRLLYRHADSLTDADLDRLVAELGVERVMGAFDRLTRPSLPFAVVSEAVECSETDDTNALPWSHVMKALRGSRNEWWAWAGCGRYVVALCGDYWNVHYQPWQFRRRQLGTAATAEEAMAIAQADYDLAREKIPA